MAAPGAKAEKPEPKPEPKPEGQRPDDAAEPLINRGTAPTSGKDEIAQAQAAMNKRMDDTKLNLPHEQLSTVKELETAFLNSDEKALKASLKKYAAKPVDGEDVMNTVILDLNELGVQASWDYSDKGQGKGKGKAALAQDTASDIGNLSFYHTNKDGSLSSVTYSTDGRASALGGLNMPGLAPSANAQPGAQEASLSKGKAKGNETPQSVLSAVRDAALKFRTGA